MCNTVLWVYWGTNGPLAEFNICNFKTDELIFFEFGFTLEHWLFSSILARSVGFVEILGASEPLELESSEDCKHAASCRWVWSGGGCNDVTLTWATFYCMLFSPVSILTVIYLLIKLLFSKWSEAKAALFLLHCNHLYWSLVCHTMARFVGVKIPPPCFLAQCALS